MFYNELYYSDYICSKIINFYSLYFYLETRIYTSRNEKRNENDRSGGLEYLYSNNINSRLYALKTNLLKRKIIRI